ncbi:HAMP domain-containing methyl-accepting chemotaxis protein [Alteromonas sp. a30]|uniref:HAMP domain-containing methyl-accepting chemotaxis protein n=1 Tax=Alteromonas sp. a30 TaxID=2730917 RepID=UPI00227DDA36|nr:methyl-accepting chemotaxis protein [Alteromonas sp. a30]MCY7296351.1 methyl-accepting chemotaxis protein [Alteromonas sp. a30]
MLKLSVVAKIIIGFVLLGVLLFITNVISYLGLSNIRGSAESVIQEKMPLQSQMSMVQNQLLHMGKLALRDYYLDSLSTLQNNKTLFDDEKAKFEKQLNKLSQLVVDGKAKRQLLLGKESSKAYLEAVENMYQYRMKQFIAEDKLKRQFDNSQLLADETTSYLLDIAFLENGETDPVLKTLAGHGNNIDIKVITLLKNVEELLAIRALQGGITLRDDMNFALRNLQQANEYLQRTSAGVDTDGLVESYQEGWAKLEASIFGDTGLLKQYDLMMSLVSNARKQMLSAEENLNNTNDIFNDLFQEISAGTLQGQSEILSQVQTNITVSFAIMFVAFASVVVIGALSARNIHRPIKSISNSMQIISSGDLTHKADDTSHCEFGELARQVNALSKGLHGLIEQIHTQQAHLQSATSQSVELGNETIKQVDKQLEEVKITEENTQRVRSSSQHNVEQINYGMTKLSEVIERTQDARGLVGKTRQQIVEQAEQAKSSAEVISRLNENSRNIGSILDVIKTIAEQTNLLALNAAIEAARAGEQGRGFAVVADEVRTLANRTQNSTEEIEHMIDALQSDATMAVDSIAKGQEQAEQSVGLIQSVDGNVDSISSIINELSGINQQIVQDTGSQDRLLQDVAERLSVIVELAEKSSGSTYQSNTAIHQLRDRMKDLETAVSRFKV